MFRDRRCVRRCTASRIPGANRNLATEDLLFMLHGMGIETGADLTKVVAASRAVGKVLGRTLPSRYLQACQQC